MVIPLCACLMHLLHVQHDIDMSINIVSKQRSGHVDKHRKQARQVVNVPIKLSIITISMVSNLPGIDFKLFASFTSLLCCIIKPIC